MAPSDSTPAPIPIPTRNNVTSPPLDPSKLNQAPAPIPTSQSDTSPSDPTPPAPLRSPEGPNDSVYLDTGSTEQPSHPTVAETGVLSPSSRDPGPVSGQLKRVDSGPKAEKEIIKLGSFGGEGLVLKPPVASGEAESTTP